MASMKTFTFTGMSGEPHYCVIRRDADDYYLATNTQSFSASIGYPVLTEDATLHGVFELSTDYIEWNDGSYTIVVYRMVGGTPDLDVDIIVGSSSVIISGDSFSSTQPSSSQRDVPTLDSIATQALKKAGYHNPTSTQIDEATTEWFSEILNDIWTLCKTLRSMLTVGTVSVTSGTSTYSLPSDTSQVVSITLMDSTASTVTWPLREMPVWTYDNQETQSGTPYYYALLESDKFILYPTPDADCSVRVRYYADLTLLSITGSLMSSLFRRWENVFKLGMYAKALQKMDDNRAESEMAKYFSQVRSLVMREQYGDDLSNLNFTVSDY